MKTQSILKVLIKLISIGAVLIGSLAIVGFGYLFIIVAAHNSVPGFFEARQESMLPTFESGKPTYIYNFDRPIKNGDIVLIKVDNPDSIPLLSSKMHIIKRIIAGPGQNIKFDKAWVYIDGKRITEPYVYGQITWLPPEGFIKENQELRLGNNQYFVMGDNRQNSYDSRSFGSITQEQILGYANDPNIEQYKDLITW